MNRCILEFVFLFVIENKAVFLDIADNWCLPSGAFQECNKAIEDPILYRAEQLKSIKFEMMICLSLTCSPS